MQQFMDIITTLKNLEFSENEVKVYLTLIKLGSSSVRQIAAESEVNRGTVYDILKSLMERGVVSYYHKKTKQYFVAEEPESLLQVIEANEKKIDYAKGQIENLIPVLRGMGEKTGKPIVKMYEGAFGCQLILKDLLTTCEQLKDRKYAIYSAESIAPFIYDKFSDFTKQRIKKKINVRVISLWEGGEKADYAERKYLLADTPFETPNHVLIYGNKVAFISMDASKELVGVVIEDPAIFGTQMILFNYLWKQL